MRKAIHQISSAHPSAEDAADALAGLLNLKKELGIEAAWICDEHRTHIIATSVEGIDDLIASDLRDGQRLVWLPVS